jgi:hypothetical protein
VLAAKVAPNIIKQGLETGRTSYLFAELLFAVALCNVAKFSQEQLFCSVA